MSEFASSSGFRALARRRLLTTVLALSASSVGVAGCLGIAGDFGIGTPDAAADATTMDVETVDVTSQVDASDAHEEEAEAGSTDASDGDAPDVVPPEQCMDGGVCTLGPCLNAQYTCIDSGRACEETGTVTNGTQCRPTADAGDGGETEVCYNGACVTCNAGGDCSAAGSCQKKTYNCSSGQAVCTDAGNQPDNTECDAGMYCYDGGCSACTVGAACTPASAPCQKGTVTSCANGIATCTASTTAMPPGTSCGTNQVCSAAGVCTTCYASLVCTPSDNDCHTGLTSCASGASQCIDTGDPQANNTACTAGTNKCDTTYTCQGGACTGSDPIVCLRMDQCHIVGTCDPSTGVCSNPLQVNGQPCQDPNLCDLNPTCEAGICTPGQMMVCPSPSDQCHSGVACDPTTGTCPANPQVQDGTPCDGGNLCILAEQCMGGVCTGGTAVSCNPIDQCHVAGTCNAASGSCSNPPAADGTSCGDGNACDMNVCEAGICTLQGSVTCSPGPCQSAATCDPGGGCTYTPVPDGTGCDEGNPCLTGICEAGTCNDLAPVECEGGTTCQPGSGVCE